MKRKYFFFDYDGTLAIPRTRAIPDGTRACIDELRARGHFVALATGRLQCNALDYIDSLGIDNIVADGGYSVTLGGELKWMRPLDLEPARECLRRLDKDGVPWAVQTANEMCRWSPLENYEEISGEYYLPCKYDPTISADSLDAIYKIYVPCKQGHEQEYISRGYFEGVTWALYDSDNIFVEPLDKACGIKMMMDLLKAPYRDVVVFGDGKNDLSMFCDGWTKIAMGNAIDELKEKADYVTESCDCDGVRLACKHFGWID